LQQSLPSWSLRHIGVLVAPQLLQLGGTPLAAA
jgi:hypothetical protein